MKSKGDSAKKNTVRRRTTVNNVKAAYFKEVVPKMKEQFGYSSIMQVPRLERIVVNTGIGKWLDQKDVKVKMARDIAQITGQKAVFTKAKKAIAGFKIKIGQEVGISSTIRGTRMYDFLERLIVATLPRVRDFRGISEKNFNVRGDVSIGIKEHIVFPEVDSENTDHIFGIEVSIVNTARTKEEGLALMRMLGLPVRSGSEESGVVEHIKSKQEEAKEKAAKEKKEKKA